MDDLDKLQEASWASTVNVFITISYTKILDIDTINQRFQAEAVIESNWVDPNIKSVSDSFDDKRMWKPDLYIENGIKDVREEVSYRIVPDSTKKWEIFNGTSFKSDISGTEQRFMICEMRKVTGIFYENLELEDFPLDVQDLTITVATKKPGNIVRFVQMQKEEKEMNISHTLDKSMWKMHNRVLTQGDVMDREYSYGVRKFPLMRVSAKVFRLPGFFYWNALLPILLVTLASLAPFVVDIKIPQSRLPATCTLMLTSVGIRWTIGRLLPTVSYLTSLDKYSLGTMLIITMELCYHAIMGALFPKLSPELAYNLDKGAFLFFCCLILTKQVLFIIWVIKVNRYRKKVRENKVTGLNQLVKAHIASTKLSRDESVEDIDEVDGKKKSRKFNLLKSLRKKNNTDDDLEAQNEGMLDNVKKNDPELCVRI
jgi:hypothetical protein